MDLISVNSNSVDVTAPSAWPVAEERGSPDVPVTHPRFVAQRVVTSDQE
jgi:hypothetical protein